MRRIIDKIELVLKNHYTETTDFLDPYERVLAKSIINKFPDIRYFENGGIIESERKVIIICNDYIDNIDDIDLNITVLRITGDLEDVSHKDYLGAIISLGIKRTKIGDILVHKDYTDIIVKNEISDFILFNLEKVGNKKIFIEARSLESLSPVKASYKELNKILSSLRLDVYISAAYNLSRQESMNIIKSGSVKINWEPIDKPAKDLEAGDVISVKGYGRSVLHSIEGISKKNKIKTSIRILI